MTKKALLAGPNRKPLVFWLSWKVLIALSLSLCILALLRLHLYSTTVTNDPILSRRLARFSTVRFEGPPRVAFLFLTRRKLPLDFVWDIFFQYGDEANYTIYVHSEPGFVFDESTTRSAFFYNRQLINSIKVGWGEASMIQAERLLLDAALQEPANQRFVLLSDSCVPLYNFSYIYSYLMASPRSFVDSFLDPKDDIKDGRYNPKMAPVIPRSKWRKGSQWISLVRSHAEVIVDDEIIFPVFKRFCKRRPPLDETNGKWKMIVQTEHNCIPDEHYVPTLLAMSDLESELERRAVTYTSWNQSTTTLDRTGWHPFTFSYADASSQKIKNIKEIKHVYYETESRKEWCKNNSTRVTCFLFARKFSQGAAMRLLSEGVVGRFDSSSLLDAPP